MTYINAFPGYQFVECGEDNKPHNMYNGEDVGFGGYVYAKPGMYGRTVTFDVASQHPSSIIAMNCFGEYTPRFKELLDARIAIKHKDFGKARTMMDGKLAPYLTDENNAKALAQALKIAINSVYGLTAANFDTPFRDIRNKNNIVALRGALFMATLKSEVINRGFTVVHCKTDSIKVVEPNESITKFIMDFGKKYGYNFEVEHIFEKICLVNDAVFIGKLAEDDPEHPGEWVATGTQFAVPYVFKTLFSKDPLVFEDMCETKSVTSALYLDANETLPDVTAYELELENRNKLVNKPDAKVKLKPEYKDISDEKLAELIAEGHDYRFVGKVGSFCPIKPGCNGGVLYREKDGKYYAATGSKGFRWMESEMVKDLNKEDDIDKSYYNTLVDKAVETISQYGDFEWFVSDDRTPVFKKENLNKLPWLTACGKETCEGCPEFTNDEFHLDCRLGYDISDIIVANKLENQNILNEEN